MGLCHTKRVSEVLYRVAAPDATCRRTLVTPHPTKANFIEPGRRPLSAMSPIIVTHRASGRLVAVAGASGGPLIVSATAQTLARWVMTAGMTVVAVYALHAIVHLLLLYWWCRRSFCAA
jgi:gamma-glutamyltranspeptidase